METKYKIIISITVVAVAYASGYYFSPSKIKIEKQIVEVEKKIDKKEEDTNKHKDYTVVVIKKPDGTEETTKHYVEDTTKKDKSIDLDSSVKSQLESKEITKSSGVLNLSVLGGVDFNSPGSSKPVYGASVTKSIIGPVTIGGWGLNNGTVGMSVGINF